MSISTEKLKKLSGIRVQSGWLFFILVAVTGKIHGLLPLLLIISGEILRTLAAGTIKKNQALANSGIYRMVRHPLYLGSFLISTGFCLMCNNIILWIYFCFFFPACYIPAIILEEKFLQQKFKSEFQEYRKSVPAFFPLKLSRMNLRGNFSWTMVLKNGEHYNWIVLLVLIIVLELKTKLASL